MSSEYSELLELVVKLKMPMYATASDDRQYTGKGWRRADIVGEQERLHDVQRELAVRQAEMVGDGGE